MAAYTKTQRIVAFCANRHNTLRDTSRQKQAGAYLAIVTQVHKLPLSSTHAEHDLLEWLCQPHTDPFLLMATKDILEQLRHAPPE